VTKLQRGFTSGWEGGRKRGKGEFDIGEKKRSGWTIMELGFLDKRGKKNPREREGKRKAVLYVKAA